MTERVSVALDADTMGALSEMAREGGHPSVAALAGSIIRDVVADDLAAHQEPRPANPTPATKVRREGFMWWVVDADGEKLAGPFGSKAAAQEAMP